MTQGTKTIKYVSNWDILKDNNFSIKFLNNLFKPKTLLPSVPELVKYISFLYLGFHTKCFQKQFTSILSKHIPFLELKLIFNNPYKIGSFFKFNGLFNLIINGIN